MAGQAEADDEAVGHGPGRREVAEVNGGGAEAEVAPGDPVEPEVDILDERVLCDDAAVVELGGVVLDPLHEPAPLELREQAELAEVREPH